MTVTLNENVSFKCQSCKEIFDNDKRCGVNNYELDELCDQCFEYLETQQQIAHCDWCQYVFGVEHMSKREYEVFAAPEHTKTKTEHYYLCPDCKDTGS